jgi:uncharacterized membrane protein YfcA
MNLSELSTATGMLWLVLAVAAALYSTSGHGGATAYLALFGLFGMAPATMRPLALALNVLVAGMGVIRLARVGAVPHRLLGFLLLGSVPGAFIGGLIPLSSTTYRGILGATLLIAAIRLFLPSDSASPTRAAPAPVLMMVGSALGMLSGLTGIGGGIFLSPLLILSRLADPRQTAGAAATFIVVNSVVGLVAVGVRGGVVIDPVVFGGCGAAVLVGGAVGSTLAARGLSFRGLRTALALVLVLSGTKLLSEWLLRPSTPAATSSPAGEVVLAKPLAP